MSPNKNTREKRTVLTKKIVFEGDTMVTRGRTAGQSPIRGTCAPTKMLEERDREGGGTKGENDT